MTSTVRADLVGGRRIAALALPALVVLAAEPLYVLVDTAVVGHLGAVPLAGLALGGNILSAAAILGNFLAYGTTGRAARRYGAGDRAGAVAEGVQASWLALAGGLGFIVAAQLLAGPVSHLLAGGGTGGAAIAAAAERWLR
ncbi:MATE family efflux transporter, partial [Actinocatenispora thailandica]|uniref:MATE family efflux transporter n=1 Tax=Actinocatenispora thailandica TaxID=227318 RepID=UPI0031D1DED9